MENSEMGCACSMMGNLKISDYCGTSVIGTDTTTKKASLRIRKCNLIILLPYSNNEFL
jgi:hypothetical protein